MNKAQPRRQWVHPDEELADLIYKAGKRGLPKMYVSGNLGYNRSTFHKWCEDYPIYLEAYERGIDEHTGSLVEKILKFGDTDPKPMQWFLERTQKQQFHTPTRDMVINVDTAGKNEEKLDFADFVTKVYPNIKKVYDKQIEMYNFAFHEHKGKTRLLLATRDIGKSILLSTLGVAYQVYLNPAITICIITDTATKTNHIITAISKLMRDNLSMFNVNKNDLHKSEIRTIVNNRIEPTIYGGSIDATLRGKHPELIVFDDIVTMENSNSRAKREQAMTVYQEAQSLTSNMLIIGNITHIDDLHSYLRGLDIPRMEIWNGEVPERTTEIELLRTRGVQEWVIQANYYGKLIESERNPFSSMKEVDLVSVQDDLYKEVKNLKIVAFFDFSFGRKGGDTCAVSFVFYNQRTLKLFALGYAELMTYSDFIDKYSKYINTMNISSVYYESNGVYDEPKAVFKKHGINAVDKWTLAEKISKINRMTPYIESITLLADIENKENLEYRKQVKGFSNAGSSQKDDAPDSLAMALIELGIIDR